MKGLASIMRIGATCPQKLLRKPTRASVCDRLLAAPSGCSKPLIHARVTAPSRLARC
jgi:hypothetical protein